MRSIIILIVLISSVYPFVAIGQVQNDLVRQNLSGNVKSLTEYNYSVKKVHGKLQELLTGKSRSNYNNHGNKTEEYIYNADASIDTRAVYTYDNGLLIQEDSYNPDGSKGFTNIYKYDKKGNIVSVKLYDGYGGLFLRTTSEYDDNDNEIEEINYAQVAEKDKHKDVVLNKTTWQYDDKGNMVKELYYDGDSAVTKTTTYMYDNSGNKTVQEKTESGTSLKTTYKYDSRGKQTEEDQYDASGNIVVKITSNYDDKGNEVEQNFYDKDNNLQTHTVFQIGYDKNGNWIRKVQIDNDRTASIIVREIGYY